MITLLVGNNSFEMSRALEQMAQVFKGTVTRIDGEDLALDGLIEQISGMSLFAEDRMVIIRDLSANKSVWNALGERLDSINDEVQLILVDPRVDKRTSTYKKLQKVAKVHDFVAWTDRDSAKAEQWTTRQSEQLGIKMDKDSIRFLVQRAGVDQWQLYHALEKLAVLDTVNREVIETTIEAQANENVFELFDAALAGNTQKIARIIAGIRRNEDPYRVLGLLSGQAFQIAALSVSKGSSADVAKDVGANPYVMSRMSSHANKLGRSGAKKIVLAIAEADTDSKSIAVDQWLLIERALVKIANA